MPLHLPQKPLSWLRLHTRPLLMGLAALLVLAGGVWVFLPDAVEVEVAALELGRFERSLQEDGKTRVRARYTVSAPLTGQLDRPPVRVGDRVSAGQTLAVIRPALPSLLDARALLEQRERTAAAQAGVERADLAIARARLGLAQAGLDLQRSETLVLQGFVSPTQHEASRLALQLRQKELDSAVQDAQAARHQLEQLRVSLAALDGTGGGSRPQAVTSPVAAQVLKVYRDSEGVVSAGAPLLDVGDPGQLEVLLDMLTAEAAQLQAGGPALLSQWGGAGTLQARVRRVEPQAFTKVSALGVEEQRVPVLLDLISPPQSWAGLGDGYRLEVRLPVQTVEQALKVPVGALFPSGDRMGVFVVEGRRARLHLLDVLARQEREAWVRTDLAVGSLLVTYPPGTLKDGDRVRVLRR
jgi:HlyD family secretion protein